MLCHEWDLLGRDGNITLLTPHTLGGASVLVHRSLDFQLLDSKVEQEGRFMFLLCRVSQLTFILAAVYIPPPLNLTALRALLTFQLGNPGIPLILVGDLNGLIDPKLDRHLSQGNPQKQGQPWHS